MEDKRANTITDICYKAGQKINSIFSTSSFSMTIQYQLPTPPEQSQVPHKFCKQAVLKCGFYMGCMSTMHFWPIPLVAEDGHSGHFEEDRSVEEVLEGMTRISREAPPHKCRKSACSPCMVNVGGQLTTLIRKHKSELTGLCLGCIKKGNYSDEAFRNNCQDHGLQMGT